MKNLQNILIDYSLFELYNLEYLKLNLIVPIFEDEMSIQLAVSKESKLDSYKSNFIKICKFKEYSTSEINFIFSHIQIKIQLYKIANSLLNSFSHEYELSKFFDLILGFAIKQRTSDIHIEVNENLLFFRFRIDGKLKTFFVFSKELFSSISSYIKLIANLDITQCKTPLDGRFSMNIENKNYDFRISTMPTINKESIVLRILDKRNLDKKLINLGYSKNNLKILTKAINLTQGLILIAGPTGSGKTTTMYSILNELISDEKKIITVEDPVEYKLNFISQIAVNNKIGLSFDVILKNILRQDPDIIFIGEIRDKFSLDIALQASLTGHLVIATIHANNSVETISRLIDLKADPYLLSTTLKYIVSQRLVLKFCTCSKVGCEKCNFTKFYGRTTIAEILKIDETISSLIFKKSETNIVKEYLKTINFKTLLDDGKSKVEDNISSFDEVYKAVNI